MKHLSLLLLSCCLILPCYAELTPEQAQAKEQGKILWNQDRRGAVPKLEPAANAGDPEAQYYLADELAHVVMSSDVDSKGHSSFYWFVQSAKQNYLPAMLKVSEYCWFYSEKLPDCHNSKTYWHEKINELAKPKAEAGDTEAMLYMYVNNGKKDITWLEKAAQAGDAEAQYRLYIAYADQIDNSWFTWFSSSKKEQAIKVLKQSADQGYPPALYSYAGYLSYYEKNYLDAHKYLIEAVDKGEEGATKAYANGLFFGDDKYNITKDEVKAYVFAKLLNDRGLLGFIKLTLEQQQEADKLLKERQENYPPISKYKSFVFYQL